ncbi:MAG TPA: vWA domain-containing protein [Anaerolineaceae bacterium]|nr:vWA domain-containing protein [Anaerolineaceae bacterium]
MKKSSRHSPTRRNSGQAIVIIAVAFVGILAFVGLVVDFGVLLINYAQLRKAVDAAAIAAAGQMREFTDIDAQTQAAAQFIELNNYDPTKVTVQTCDTLTPEEQATDTELCPTPRRKLIRVIAEGHVTFFFLPVIGFYGTDIKAQAIGEAASLDVVLILDRSNSMAYYDADRNLLHDDDPMRNPDNCNPGNNCHPFAEVKAAANSFIDRLKFPLDRVAIIQFDLNASAPQAVGSGSFASQSVWFTGATAAKNVINGMTVYKDADSPYPETPDPPEPTDDRNYNNPAPRMSTNIGGSLRLGGNQFNYQRRRDAVWIVVLLTDGAANVTDHPIVDGTGTVLLEHGYCPYSTWYDGTACADTDPDSRHSLNNRSKKNPNNHYDPFALNAFDFIQYQYDADDYARDMADYVGCPSTTPTNANSWCFDSLHYAGGEGGQGATIFTIGLGPQVLDYYGYSNGAYLLRYIAAVGYDNDPTIDETCGGKPADIDQCGNYYYAPNDTKLQHIFEQIASKIYTRISH